MKSDYKSLNVNDKVKHLRKRRKDIIRLIKRQYVNKLLDIQVDYNDMFDYATDSKIISMVKCMKREIENTVLVYGQEVKSVKYKQNTDSFAKDLYYEIKITAPGTKYDGVYIWNSNKSTTVSYCPYSKDLVITYHIHDFDKSDPCNLIKNPSRESIIEVFKRLHLESESLRKSNS